MFQVSPWQFVFHTRIDVTREYLTTNTNKSVEAEPSISALVTTDYHSFLLFEILLYYPLKRVRINRFILFIRHFLSYALDNFFSQNLFLINLNLLIMINNENMYMTIILFHYFSILNHSYSSNNCHEIEIFISLVSKSAENKNKITLILKEIGIKNRLNFND